MILWHTLWTHGHDVKCISHYGVRENYINANRKGTEHEDVVWMQLIQDRT
jgi:hypothetical protein